MGVIRVLTVIKGMAGRNENELKADCLEKPDKHP